MKDQALFRRVALERLSSPEQLDQLMAIVSARLWLALLAVAVLIGAVCAWSFLGTIPTRVAGAGVLIRTGGVSDITAGSSGPITDLAVAPGDVVREGQVVARIDQPILLEELRTARARLEEHAERHHEMTAYLQREDSLNADLLVRERAVVARSMRAAEEELGWLVAKERGQEGLLRDGLIRQEDLLATSQRLAATRIRLEQLQSELQELGLRHVGERRERDRQIRQSAHQLASLKREVWRIEDAIRHASQVRSPHSGRILEVMVEVGSQSQQGRPLMRLDRLGQNQQLEAVIYVPGHSGKRVHRGMKVQLSPATVRREEHGYMIGQVEAVSEYPATQEGMHRTLKNQNLVQLLSGGGAPYETFVSLRLDPVSSDGYAWSGAPPGIPIQSGTLCTATITTDRRRPIELIIPYLRQTAGI